MTDHTRPRSPQLHLASLVLAIELGANTADKMAAVFRVGPDDLPAIDWLCELLDAMVRHQVIREDVDAGTFTLLMKGQVR